MDGIFSKEVVYVGGTALVGVVGVLWRMINQNREKSDKRAEETEARLQTREDHLLKLTGEVGELRGRVELSNQIAPKLDDIHSSVLTLVNNSSTNSEIKNDVS